MLRTDTIQITPEMLSLIAGIDEFKGAWRALGTLAPDRLAALQREATIESIGATNRIKGSRLSDQDVARLLASPLTSPPATREEQEIVGHAEVMNLVLSFWREMPFTERRICQLHEALVCHSEKDAALRGSYKVRPNTLISFGETGVPSGLVLATVSPEETPQRMRELVDWVNRAREAGRLHPVLIIALFVVAFLDIHPFQSGNLRLCRVLTTLLLLQAGYAYVPYSSLESVVEQSRDAYYLALRQTQRTIRSGNPNWQLWVVFFLCSLAEQVRRLEQKIKREKTVLAEMPELQLKIVEFAREHGRVTIGKAIKLTGASRNTLKPHFRTLVESGTLDQHGSGRGVWYGIG